MEIVRFEDEAVWFAPDIGDNRSKPPEKRFRVKVRPLTRGELTRVQAAALSKVSQADSEDDLGQIVHRLDTVRNATIRAAVLEVENLWVRRIKDGAKTTEAITNADGLVELAPEEILEDIKRAVVDHSVLEAGLLGKYDFGPDSPAPPKADSGTGDAASAAAQSSQSTISSGPHEAASQSAPLRPSLPRADSSSAVRGVS